MANEFAKNCKGCKYSGKDIDVITIGEDAYISNGYKTCTHPKNEDEHWIPFLHNCPWKIGK